MPTINIVAPDYKVNTTRLVGLQNDQVILESNTNPKFSPAKMRIASLPLSGGDLKALDLKLNGQQMPSSIFGNKIAVYYTEPMKPQKGFIVSDKNVVWLSTPNDDKKLSIQPFKINEFGVFGTARNNNSFFGCLWDFQGNLISTSPRTIIGMIDGQLITDDFKVNLPSDYTSSKTFAVVKEKVFIFGFLAGKPISTATSRTFIYNTSTNQLNQLFTGNWDHVRPLSYSTDGRYVIGIAIKLGSDSILPSQDTVLIDTLTDTLVSMSELTNLPVGQIAGEFDENNILCTVWDESKNSTPLVSIKDWAY